jgi:AcrR family transcriptional regulator
MCPVGVTPAVKVAGPPRRTAYEGARGSSHAAGQSMYVPHSSRLGLRHVACDGRSRRSLKGDRELLARGGRELQRGDTFAVGELEQPAGVRGAVMEQHRLAVFVALCLTRPMSFETVLRFLYGTRQCRNYNRAYANERWSQMSSDPSPRRAIGRPREARADRAILTATLQLMAERGVRDLRMDDVAERAGVGKATIYRRYRSKDSLVSDAIATLVSEITIPDAGSTRADLLALMRQAVELYSGSLAARLMPAVLEETRRNPELASTVRDEFLAGRRTALSVVLERGVRRGDLRGGLDLELALDVLGGAIFYRLLVTGGPIDEQLAQGVVELILAGFAPTRKGGTKAVTPKDR